MAVKGNLEADHADFAVLRVRFAFVDPGIRHMGFHFALEVVVHRLTQRHVLVVAQPGIGFRLASDQADFRLGVALTQGVSAAGLMTMVQPAASAGPALRVIMAMGKFQGVMAATTPTGCLMVARRRSAEKPGMVRP